MKLGHKEQEMLYEIDQHAGDLLMGVLFSAGSTTRAYQIAHTRAKERAIKASELAELKRQRKRILKRLEAKGMVRLVGEQEKAKIILQKPARAYVHMHQIISGLQKNTTNTWDGKWTLLMFDFPQHDQQGRLSLLRLLDKIGFVQVQMSNYAFPYAVPELSLFLRENPRWGDYCHVFRGKYEGDENALRKKFNLL